ncbi:PstS family phosphate ABC transporter substrate-binding protein [Moorena producens JHB]|uniref:Phosphate-binding protein n=1 Tax=Moorena producens (strain JHB) TaxID=1454205 RepID=A0A1D9G5A2_MOOP1|nr:PstS family phosphate ABC transporter substrate-binding protein [Moorena producens]AOY82796.1 PstS family phosphate ABC transporter substrate-binding protein [Moorena producens JHB]
MNFKKNSWKLAGLFALVASTVALVAPTVNSQGRPTVRIDGSSTVYPITEAVAEEFQDLKKNGVRVTVGISGTGGGFKKFCKGETDISDASRPIKDKEKALCAENGIEYMAIPVAYDAITVVVNKGNTAVTDIKVEELNKMWKPESEGTVTKWSQVNSNWPDLPLVLYGPGADSGTFDYFTKKINGKSGASRTDYTPSEDDNVLVQGVETDLRALAYFGLSYYLENKDKLKAVAINGVTPSLTTVRNGTYTPLSRPIFIYVNKNAAKRTEINDFVTYYLQNAERLVTEVKSVPLSSADYAQSLADFQQLLATSGN